MTKDDTKEESKFLKKLKATCKKCTPASIKVYTRSIKRLYNLEFEGEVPATGSWLNNKKLVKKYEDLALNIRRHLSVAGLKACLAYKTKDDAWRIRMMSDSMKYSNQREKNEKSEKEEKLWPKGGYAAIKKASSELLKRIKHQLKEEPNLAIMYRYQMYIALKMFAEAPMRNTFASLQIGEHPEGNYIETPKKGSFTLVIRKHKASKKIGERRVKLSRGMTTALRKFLRYREKTDVRHKFMFTGKLGKKLSKSAFGKALHRVTKEIIGKAFGSRIIRVLAATSEKESLDKIADLSNKMLHGKDGAQTKLYARNK